MPIYGKTTWKSSSAEPRKLQGWILVYSIQDLRSTKFSQMMILWWPLTFLWQCQICSPIFLYGENEAILEESCKASADMQWPIYSSPGPWASCFLFLYKNICCGYSLEVPHWGASNEYPQHIFLWRNKKTNMWIPPLIGNYTYSTFPHTVFFYISPNYHTYPISSQSSIL